MIFAGIDEAGYGPLLGPLTIACCAIRTPGDHMADLPDLWKRLSRHVSTRRSSTGRKLHVNDSKLVYTPSSGLKELERSVLCFLLASDLFQPQPGRPAALDDLLAAAAPDLAPDLACCPWYLPQADERYPLETELLSLQLFCKAMREDLATASTTCIHYRCHVFLEEPLNRMMEATRNKASASFTIVARHIDHLLRNYASEGLVIFCDRQGGRCHYGSLLRMMFEDFSLVVVHEEADRCEYHLTRTIAGADQTVRIIFAEKAEAQAMPVALASMLAKYLRESLMHRYNLYWQALVPGLVPTAGYWQDGTRFLQDIAAKRQELAIPDAKLVRSR